MVPKITSEFAILDVKQGRKALAKRFPQTPYLRSDLDRRIPVVIHGFIASQWGSDDGMSIEFGVDVTKVEISEPEVA